METNIDFKRLYAFFALLVCIKLLKDSSEEVGRLEERMRLYPDIFSIVGENEVLIAKIKQLENKIASYVQVKR